MGISLMCVCAAWACGRAGERSAAGHGMEWSARRARAERARFHSHPSLLLTSTQCTTPDDMSIAERFLDEAAAAAKVAAAA